MDLKIPTISILAGYFAGFFMKFITELQLTAGTSQAGELIFGPIIAAFWPITIWFGSATGSFYTEPITVLVTAIIVGGITFLVLRR